MKKFISVSLSLILLFVCGCSAFALEIPPSNHIANNTIRDSGYWINKLRSDDFAISYTSYGIEKKSSTSIFVAGTTRTNKRADIVRVLITVQQWSNNQWNNYSSTSNRANSASECQHSATISVKSGYYYRIHVTHEGLLGLDSQTHHSYSKSTLIE